FRAVDLYVSCSLSDGSSVSLLEAMATGLPVVVSDTPGNREWVVSGKNGWLAPVGDADAFAGHLITSIRSGSSARARISQANRGIAERRADWSRNSGQLRPAYERLAGAWCPGAQTTSSWDRLLVCMAFTVCPVRVLLDEHQHVCPHEQG